MKKTIIVLSAVCALLASCKKQDKDNPPLSPRPTGYLLSKIKDDNGNSVMEYHYDQFNHLLRADYYDTRGGGNSHTATVYTYNSQGLVDTMKVVNDSFAEMNYYHIYRYDAAGRVIKRYHAYNGYDATTSAGYDYSYNAIGEIARRSVSGVTEVNYIYNADGDMVKADFQNRDGSDYTYDSHPRPSTNIDYLPEENVFPAHFVGLDYTPASQLSRHNITNDKIANTVFEYTYNSQGYPASMTMTRTGYFSYTVHLEYIKIN